MEVTPPATGSADPAVQLTTLPGWRQFVAAVPSVPVLLPEQDWLSLEDGKRASTAPRKSLGRALTRSPST
jgi:hypothetical protein